MAQKKRTKNKAEVFTPSWLCNEMNNYADEQWFGYPDAFNKPGDTPHSWIKTRGKVQFPNTKEKTWKDYVYSTRLEITCGEAPYLVSRYDTTTGKPITVARRIGLLDRKLRVVNENTDTYEDWLFWTLNAYRATYGYEYQGDNLLIARINLLETFIDNKQLRWEQPPTNEELEQVATIISWNLWQMDGIKGVIPNSCGEKVTKEYTLFGDEIETVEKCKGCESNDIYKHNGVYCKIKDWKSRKTIRFIDLLNK
jgi:hypothetical protein